MAKFVLAGRADCPYYAKAELLADYLVKNLPNFRIHKITQHPDNWERWLQDICNENGWKHKRSPIIWRELLDRGGKGLLLGGFNEFLEHAQQYYDITSNMMTEEMLLIANENLETCIEIESEEKELKSLINPLHIWLNRSVFKDILLGIVMETEDLASPVLRSVTLHTELEGIFLDADIIILLDDILQETTFPTLELCIQQVTDQCKTYGPLIEQNAKSNVKIIVMGKTFTNLKSLMLMTYAPSINPRNIITLAMLLESEARAMVARKMQMHPAGIKNIIVWGNISGNSFVDLSKTELYRYDSAIWGPPSFFRPLLDVLFDREWMQIDFVASMSSLTSWGSRGLGMASAHTIATILRYWYQGSPPGEMISLGVISEGQFGLPEGIVYSMPVRFENGSWEIATEIEINEKNQSYLLILAFDLIREKQFALGEVTELNPQRREIHPIYREVAEEEEDFKVPDEPTTSLIDQERPLESEDQTVVEEMEDSDEYKDMEEENIEGEDD
ncbi:putative malate dehydrogenase 1B isoform X2 [Erythrolamprus reginae]|uniref:putative malate dehydrogenase 1B isoform X2 n=1 Tax=Erythrolamprus reginae TaxID=121349 RepID=UPI00396CB42D